MAPRDEAPRSYQDLPAPKWKGKMNFGSNEYAWYSVRLEGVGKAKGLDFMRSLARQQHNASILFIDWMLSEEGQTVLAQQIPRITLRKGIKQIPRHQELYKKKIVFVSPASIGPNLNELVASYQRVSNIR